MASLTRSVVRSRLTSCAFRALLPVYMGQLLLVDVCIEFPGAITDAKTDSHPPAPSMPPFSSKYLAHHPTRPKARIRGIRPTP